MKKLAVIFAGLSLFVATSCNDDKEDPVTYFPITGTWQPIRETWTEVPNNPDPVSDPIYYTACQQQSRWVFQSNFSGSIEDHDDTAAGTCAVTGVRTFTYSYNGNGDDNFQIKYGGQIVPQTGKVTKLTANEMNIKLETIDNAGYHSKTYSFKRVQ